MTTWTPPTPAEVEAKIQEMVRRIVAGCDPDRIILFGSQARGDATPDSDVDLLVVLEHEGQKLDSIVKIRLALTPMGIGKDIFVLSPDEFEADKDLVGTLAYPAAHEGRVLYERPR